MKKKIFSILLSLCMVLTMMPMATGTVWAEETSVATSVTIGDKTLYANTPYYHNGTDGAVGEVNNSPEGANATFNSTNGTLTLNGLNLTSGKISATGDLTILLTGENQLGSKTYSSNVIYVNNGKLEIVGSGALTAENASGVTTTIYVNGDITINGGARVTATHAGGDAQAIHASGQSQITISGADTEVTATHNGTGSSTSDNYVALKAGTIQISNGAKLTAKGEAKAVYGTLSVDNLENYTIYAGDSQDSATEKQNPTEDLTALSAYKYLKFESQATAPTSSISLDTTGIEFTAATVGYGAQTPKTVTVTNTGNAETGELGVALSGTNKDSFELNKNKIESIAVGGSHTFTVTPNANLAAGTYTAKVTVSGQNIASQSFNVSFTVNATGLKRSIKLSVEGTYTFPEATVGYSTPAAKEVTITSTGTAATGKLFIALDGADETSFKLNKTVIDSIAVGGSATFTVTPNANLAAGTYTAKVTVSDGNLNFGSFDVSFTVKASSGGGSHSASIQKPTIIADEGAETSLSILGTNLTIKMTEGYELTDVILNGVSKGKVTELTGLRTGDTVEVKTEKKQEKPTKAEIIAALDSSKLVARSKLITLENGKKAVRVTWYDQNGNEIDFDGIEVYRSVKRYKGYGLKPFYTTKGDKSEGYYVNTKDLKEGTTYYYKVRGYVTIDGQKYYTDYSLKAIRTIR